jgi:hypothetical protein
VPGNGRLRGFGLNKGGGPRVPLAKTNIFFILVFLDLAGVFSSGRLLQRTPLGTSCLGIARSNGICLAYPCFFWLFGFRGNIVKVFCLLPLCDMSYGSWCG